MTEDEKIEWAGNLTLESTAYPEGFACLAAAVRSHLMRYGKCFLYVDDEGNILGKDPEKEVAVSVSPVLVVDPSAVVDDDEERNLLTISLEGVQLLDYGALILDDPGEIEESDLE